MSALARSLAGRRVGLEADTWKCLCHDLLQITDERFNVRVLKCMSQTLVTQKKRQIPGPGGVEGEGLTQLEVWSSWVGTLNKEV